MIQCVVGKMLARLSGVMTAAHTWYGQMLAAADQAGESYMAGTSQATAATSCQLVGLLQQSMLMDAVHQPSLLPLSLPTTGVLY